MVLVETLAELAKGAGLFVLLFFVISRTGDRFDDRPIIRSLVNGTLFGAAAVIGMLMPLAATPGLAFDTRTLFIGIGGAFGGAAVAVIAAAMAIACQLILEGPGEVAGLAVIVTSALIGTGFCRLRKHMRPAPRIWHSLLFAFVLHVAALFWHFVLPGTFPFDLVLTAGFAMLVTFTPATMLLYVLLMEIGGRAAERRTLQAYGADYSRILGSMKNMFFRVDTDGVFTRVSPSVTPLLGYLPEEMVGRAASDFYVEPSDREVFLSAMAAGGGRVRDYEMMLRAKDGSSVQLSMTSYYLYDADGTYIGIEGIGRDFSDRRQAEERVHTLIERLSLATRAGGIGIWERDIATGTVVWDRKMCEMYGLPGDGYTGTPDVWKRRLHPDDVARVASEIDDAIASKDEFSLAFRTRWPDGSIRHIESYAIVRRDAGGVPLHLIGMNRDITEKVEAEQRLVESQKMEMVGQLTGGLAHDFNNLLAVILGNLEFMDDHIEPDSTLDSLKKGALRATLRGADLTQRLLAFSRKQALRPEYTDTDRLIQELSELMRRTLGEQVEIECRLKADQHSIMIDPGQLENALLNLAINARDAMVGGGRITIETANTVLGADDLEGKEIDDVTPGPYLVISISDSGSGMPDSVRERVFEPFFTTKEAGKGSGLGLSMVYGFVKQSGGQITIDSRAGAGTKIRLYLPRTKHAPRQLPAAAHHVQRPSGTECVLVVENDPDVRDHLEAALQMLGYQVATASDGPAAMALLDKLPALDLLITDIVMPRGMNGLDVAENVRKRYAGVRILYTSGNADQAVGTSDKADNSVAFLPKPYRRTVLAQTIRQLLDAA